MEGPTVAISDGSLRSARFSVPLSLHQRHASCEYLAGSTRLLFAGASNLKSRVRFVEAMGAYVPLHAACERMLPCLNTVDARLGSSYPS